MCGIAGFVGNGTREDIERMTDSLRYRGPDASGFFVDGQVALGHRRLSIIDLKSGAQPMRSADDNFVITFNGEIYNFKELRLSLQDKGYEFLTESDTEVILAAYKEYGTGVVEHLNGMFAFALWDKQRSRLLMARDRLGQKPLYYSLQNGNFIFASELKAFLQHPSFEKRLNRNAAQQYFLYEYIPSPQTIFDGVFKLEPGHTLVYADGAIQTKQYWDVDLRNTNSEVSLDQAKAELDKHLADAVKRRMIADVPLGLFLSGGLDSSAIAWYAAKVSNTRIKTFSVAFSEASFDESAYARKVAQHIDADHRELHMNMDEIAQLVKKLPEIFDEPIADGGALPQYVLANKTREHVTVALSGDAGDELFYGYQTFVAERYYQVWKRLPKFVQSICRWLVNKLPTSFKYLSFDYKAKQFVRAHVQLPLRHQGWLGAFSFEDMIKLLKEPIGDLTEPVESFDYKGAQGHSDEAAAFYQQMYMPQKVLAMVDRTSMQNSLEVRSPFLDHVVVDYVNSLPSKYKLLGKKDKYILRELMHNRLPQEIVERPKKGFTVPMGLWANTHWNTLVHDVLSCENIERAGLLNYSYVEQLISDNESKKVNNGRKIYALLMWQLWYNHYFA